MPTVTAAEVRRGDLIVRPGLSPIRVDYVRTIVFENGRRMVTLEGHSVGYGTPRALHYEDCQKVTIKAEVRT